MKKKLSSIILLMFVLQLLMASAAWAGTSNVEAVPAEQPGVVKTGTDPLWTFLDISVPEKILIGQNFEMIVTVRNIGTGSGIFPSFKFSEGKDNMALSHFSVVSSDGADGYDPMITEIKSGQTQVFTIVMKVNSDVKELPEGSDYQLNCTIGSADGYVSAEGSKVDWSQKRHQATQSLHLKPVYALSEPTFVVDSVTFSPEVTDGVKETTAIITLENISDTKANNVVVTLEGSNVGQTGKKNIIIKDLTSTKRLYDVRGKQKIDVAYQVEINPDRMDNEMTLTIKYDGQKEAQKELINMPLPLDSTGTGKEPKVIIERYTLEPEKVLAGNNVTLNLYIQNTNALPVKNISIKLDVPTETTGSGSSVSSGTVFSPVNSSNTFYIERIEGKTTEVKTITMYVSPNASAKTYVVPVKISYENSVGETCPDITDNINIPVAQESRIEIIKGTFPRMGNVGEPINLDLDFVNIGKTTLTNLKIQAAANVSNNDDSVYYVGTFEVGATDEYNGVLYPEEEGLLEGAVQFTYIDGDNQEALMEVPFSIEIGPEIVYEPIMPEMPIEVPKETFASKIKGHLLDIILVVIILVQGVMLFKIKRKEKAEEELMQ